MIFIGVPTLFPNYLLNVVVVQVVINRVWFMSDLY